MKKDILAFSLLACMVAVIALGCGRGQIREVVPPAPRPFSAAAGFLTVDQMKYIAWGGAGLMVLGVAAYALKRRRAGVVLFFGGGMMAYTFASLTEYPWVSVIIPLALMLSTMVLAIYLFRNKDVLRELVRAIQRHPEVKPDIGDGDPARQAAIKGVVTPIKLELASEEEGGASGM